MARNEMVQNKPCRFNPYAATCALRRSHPFLLQLVMPSVQPPPHYGGLSAPTPTSLRTNLSVSLSTLVSD